MIVLNFCFSNDGDMAKLFRRTATQSKMMITHDLRIITNNPALKLDAKQEAFLEKIGNGCFKMKVTFTKGGIFAAIIIAGNISRKEIKVLGFLSLRRNNF